MAVLVRMVIPPFLSIQPFYGTAKRRYQTELVQLVGTGIRGCNVCGQCFEKQDKW